MNRRIFLASGAAIGFARPGHAQTFEISLSDAEWQKRLTPAQFKVLRQEDTEPSGSSPLDNEHRNGIFACAGCDLPLYSSDAKYDSGTGWPSFYQPLKNAVGTKEDDTLFTSRTGRETKYHLAIDQLQDWAYLGAPVGPLKGYPGVAVEKARKKPKTLVLFDPEMFGE